MPVLPTYTANRNITANPSAPLRDEAAAPFQATQKAVGAVQDVVQAWSDAQDVMDYTKFKADTGTAIASQKALAELDPNEDNQKEHLDALNKLKDKSLSVIKNASVRQKASFELDHDISIASIEIGASFQKKKMLTNQIKLEENIKSNAERRSSASTPSIASQVDLETLELIKGNVSSGLITEAHGRKLINDYRLGHVDLDIMNDKAISKDTSYVYAQLSAGKKGIYADLSDAERADRLEKTELHVRRNKIMNGYAVSRNQDATEKELLMKHGTDSITEGDVRNLLVSTGIDLNFGDKYIKSMYKLPAEETDHATYNSIKLEQLSGVKGKKINSKILDAIDKLTVEDRNKIIQSTYDPLDKRTMNIRASAEALGNWASTVDNLISDDNAPSEVVFNFLKRVESNPNSNVDETISEVQKDYIKKAYPNTSLMKDVPNIIGNRNKIISVYKKQSKAGGQKAVVSPVSSSFAETSIGFDDL